MNLKLTFTILSILMIAVNVSDAVPNVINNQGRITNSAGEPVADDAYLVKFIIYDAPVAGTALWNSNFQTINTVDGLFNYQLGSNVALPSNIFADTNRYLGITLGTNPEITPRTRFITTSYAFKAQSADIALDANTLGGSQPAYYLDWNNLSNIPAGFADGVDNNDNDWGTLTGIPAGFADGVDDGGISYSAGSGLVLNGSTFSIPTGAVTSTHLGSGSVGASEIATGAVGVDELGSNSVGAAEIINESVGSAEIGIDDVGAQELAANSVGSSEIATNAVGSSEIASSAVGSAEIAANSITVFDIASGGVASTEIEDNSIRYWDIVDEPGVTQGSKTTSTTLTTGEDMEDIITTTITIPTTGYIFLIGKCYLTQSGTTGINYTDIQIDQNVAGSSVSPHFIRVGYDSYPNTDGYRFPVTVTRMYFMSAGTYTFRLEADKYWLNSVLAVSVVYQPVLTAMYFPTSYGSVSTVSPDPNIDPSAVPVSITDEAGNTTTGYEVDLRNLELRAKEAELREFEAKQALEDAQNENQ
jgi:hypothetical protein